MPRLKSAIPKYRKHRASGQAVVTLGGKDIYLGPHGTKTSKAEYDRLIAEWLRRGRTVEPAEECVPIVQLCVNYSTHCNKYYRKNGKPTSEVAGVQRSLIILRELYGHTSCEDFGPLALKAVRQRMVDMKWNRTTVNQQTARIVRMFRWGAENELIAAELYHRRWKD